MKVCNLCGKEIFTKDGDNTCAGCEDAVGRKRAKAKADRQAREQALKDCGLVKVRGALGGTYWE